MILGDDPKVMQAVVCTSLARQRKSLQQPQSISVRATHSNFRQFHAIFNYANVDRLKHMSSLTPMQFPAGTPTSSTQCDAGLKGKTTLPPHAARDKQRVILQLQHLDSGRSQPLATATSIAVPLYTIHQDMLNLSSAKPGAALRQSLSEATRPAAYKKNGCRHDTRGWSGRSVPRSRQTRGRSSRHCNDE
jgi:hypothetical protein